MNAKILMQNARDRVNRAISKTVLQQEIEKEISVACQENGWTPFEISKEVKEEGFLLLENVLSDTVMDKMMTEFREIIDHKYHDFAGVDKHDGSVCVRIKPVFTFKNRHNIPAIHAFFGLEIFRHIVQAYYDMEQGQIDYMSEIFVHETPETKEPLSGRLHWDRAQTLKFWVYLDDVPIEAGPMNIEPRSIARNKVLREQLSEQSKGRLTGGKDNLVHNVEQALVALTAGKGSILIHDTDASHGASEVKDGYVRRIIRGHCRLN